MKIRYLLLIVLPLLLGLSFVDRFFSMPSISMYPLLEKGEWFYVDDFQKENYSITRGDVVSYNSSDAKQTKYIKRVIAVAGDILQINQNLVAVNDNILTRELIGQVTYNGLKYDKFKETSGNKTYEIVLEKNHNRKLPSGRYKIPEGHLFLLGDNRDNSKDSRYLGFVPISSVIGIYSE